MNRKEMIGALGDTSRDWDIVVIGGGATGLGCAVDAASRGYRTVLLERGDFSSGTSSRSTKLIHGGVRYLRQGNIRLVVDALREKRILSSNAPQLVTPIDFVIPLYKWWEGPYYLAGLRFYDLLARRVGDSSRLSVDETRSRLPTVRKDCLRGGILYSDSQFDDARLAIALAHSAVSHGAVVANYCAVTGLMKESGHITGVVARDLESGADFEVRARVVLNATGVFVDKIRSMDVEGSRPLVRPSRGSHVVLDAALLPGASAMLVPRTDDGRVIFAIPWRGSVVVGTTDVPTSDVSDEPFPSRDEIDFLLSHTSRYFDKEVRMRDVLSAFSGLRPLIARGDTRTSALSRDHHVVVSTSGLVTISGGKWTTYRKMAQDAIDHACRVGELPSRPCRTKELRIPETTPESAFDATLEERARHAIRNDMARTVEDFLGRRDRTLFLDARAAIAAAPAVAGVLADELGRDDAWRSAAIGEFERLARKYLPADT